MYYMDTISNLLSTIFMNEHTIIQNASSETGSNTVSEIKRFKMTAKELSLHNNIILLNFSSKDHNVILEIILARLSLLSNISTFSKTIHSKDCNGLVNKIILNEPDMHFNNVSEKIPQIGRVVSIRNGTSTNSELGNLNIYIESEYCTSLIDSGSSSLVIHKKDSNIKLQNKFFFNVVTKLTKYKQKDYLRFINDQNTDVTYIVIHNGKLMYM